MKKMLFIVLLTFATLVSTNSQEKLAPLFMQVNVKNLDASKNWYKNNLGFNILSENEKSAILENNTFYILLNKITGYVSEKETKLPEGKEFIDGYSKVGFVTNNIDQLFRKMRANRVQIFREISQSEFFDGRYFIVSDPDGNFIHLFTNESNSAGALVIRPFMFGKVVADIDKCSNWYASNFGSKETGRLDLTDFNIKINYLEINSFYIELLETKVSVTKAKMTSDPFNKLLGIVAFGFSGNANKNLSSKLSDGKDLLPELLKILKVQSTQKVDDPNEDKIFILF